MSKINLDKKTKTQTQYGMNLSQKKRKALELIQKYKYTYKHAGEEVGIHEVTVSTYIHDIVNNYKMLSPEKRIAFWESESVRDKQLASLIREMLLTQIAINPDSISPSEKRAIFYAASMSSGLAWDKAHPKAEVQVNVGIRGQIDEVAAEIRLLKSELESEEIPPDVVVSEAGIEAD